MLSRRYCVLLFLILFCPAIVFAVFFSGFVKPLKVSSDTSLYLGDSWSKSGKWYSGHLGEDLIVGSGTKVYSVADGIVEESNKWPSCNKIEIIDGVKKKVEDSHSWGGVVIIKHDLEKMGSPLVAPHFILCPSLFLI